MGETKALLIFPIILCTYLLQIAYHNKIILYRLYLLYLVTLQNLILPSQMTFLILRFPNKSPSLKSFAIDITCHF